MPEPLPGIITAEAMHQTLERCRSLLGRPEEGEPSLLAERKIDLVAQREASLADCLLVPIFGGTKVGKTTLINALAGQEIGQASARACFTHRPAVYVHATREAQARSRLRGLLREDDQVITHRKQNLERIILIDTPDLDGIEERHHEVFREVLERSDLALCLVTTQKYDSADLFKVLGTDVGFRRVLFVFNRIDEGIPLTESIEEDLRTKIAPFGLRSPEGGPPSILGVSARNALLRKQEGTSGPTGKFGQLEHLLHERLDAVRVEQISRENMTALLKESQEALLELAGIHDARRWLETFAEREADLHLSDRNLLQQRLTPVIRGLEAEVACRREQAAAHAVGGPFGAYLRARLAIAALPFQLRLLATAPGDAAETLAGRILEQLGEAIDECCASYLHALVESCERANIQADRGVALLREPVPTHEERAGLAESLREHLEKPSPGSGEVLVVNTLPSIILLLLVYYFVQALLAGREPGAGIFLGGGLLFWLICHLQASFWLPRKAGSLDQAGHVLAGRLLSLVKRRTSKAVRPWIDQVRALANTPFSTGIPPDPSS